MARIAGEGGVTQRKRHRHVDRTRRDVALRGRNRAVVAAAAQHQALAVEVRWQVNDHLDRGRLRIDRADVGTDFAIGPDGSRARARGGNLLGCGDGGAAGRQPDRGRADDLALQAGTGDRLLRGGASRKEHSPTAKRNQTKGDAHGGKARNRTRRSGHIDLQRKGVLR